jgi:hypothetical protein
MPCGLGPARSSCLAVVLSFACGGNESTTAETATDTQAGDLSGSTGDGSSSGGVTSSGGAADSEGADDSDGESSLTSDGDPWEPDPIPDIPDEVPAPCQAAIDDPYYFQFLDDICGDKRLPSDTDRSFACPVVDESATVVLAGGGTVTYQPPGEPPDVDTTSLDGLLPPGMRLTIILVRRVGGVPHYRYLSNGTHDVAFQPWSTTKFLAAANAAVRLRTASDYEVGLGATVSGHAVGDLVTALVDYTDDPFGSNALGRYFHDVGGRAAANAMIHAAWLGRPANETFGGNYGAAAPNLGFSFTEPGGASVTITPDTSTGPANHLSTFTTAEALKRLVLHREDATGRLPGIQWADVEVLLYGAEESAKGPFGGLSADTAIYLQTGHDIDYLEARSHGRFRIFSKLGLGTGGQFLNVGYACFPVLDPVGDPVPGWGRELVISAALDTTGTWKQTDRELATAFRGIIKRVIDGTL